MKKKNFIVSSILFLVLLFSMMTASAEGKQDVRIAVLPLQMADGVQLGDGVRDKLDTAFQRSVDAAAGSQRSFVTYVPKDESMDVYREILNRVEGNDDPAIVLKPLAIVVDADLVLQPELLAWQQKDYLALNQARTQSLMYTASVAAIRVTGYDRKRNKIFTRTETRTYDYEQSNIGEASYLARKCMDKALKDAELSVRIREAAQEIHKK